MKRPTIYPRPGKLRLHYPIPNTLYEQVHMRAEKHIPRPQKNHFIQYLLELAMEEYEAGRTTIGRGYSFRGPEVDLSYFVKEAIVRKFSDLFDKHEPITYKQHFFAYMLALGLQKYEKLYNDYGFLDED